MCYIVHMCSCVCVCAPQVNGKKVKAKMNKKKSHFHLSDVFHSIPQKNPEKPKIFSVLAQSAYISTSVSVAVVTHV